MKSRKELLLVLILTIVLLCPLDSFARLCNPAFETCPPPKEETPQDRALAGDYTGMSDSDFATIDWGATPTPDQSKVPPEKVHLIPPEHVQVTNVKDQSKLTYDQLKHGTNFNQITDKSKLNPQVLNQFLSEQSEKNVKAETNSEPTEAETFEGGFEFQSIYSIRFGSIFANRAQNFRYERGAITIGHADQIIINSTIATNVDNILIMPTYFQVESAGEVKAGRTIFTDVKNASFALSPGIVHARPNTTLSIKDANDAETAFIPGNNSVISISEATPATYQISNGTLIFENESFASENTAIITLDPQSGFICINIFPPGTYFRTYADTRKDFGIHVYQQQYSLCFRKNHWDNQKIPESEHNYGLIDLYDNITYLNGQAH